MAIHIQRKRFGSAFEATGVAEGFRDPAFNIPGISISTSVVEEADGIWLYVRHDGEFVADNVLILPDYEKVNP